MRKMTKPAVTPLLIKKISRSKVLYAQGMKAGRWIFATGHMATDFKNGLAPAVFNPRLPHYGKPKNEREAEIIFGNLKNVLRSGGSDFANVVRLDQYYSTWKAVDPYHVVRRNVFGKYIAPSTSILQRGLLLPGADIEVQMIAIVPQGGFKVQAILPSEVETTPTSGYMPIVRAGDYVFVAGQMATWGKGNEGGIAPEARVLSGHLWRGTQIKLETEYIIRRRLEPALQAAGSSLSHVIKAQIYLSKVDDFGSFNEVWARYFPKDPPVTTLIPTATPGFGIFDASIEINAIALVNGGKTEKKIIESDVFTGYDNQSVAIRAGDLLFISGLMALDRNGLIPEGEVDPHQPYFSSSIQAQMDFILQNAAKICHAADTSLENVVRIQQFHTNLRDFYPAYQVWQHYLPGLPLPFSAVQIPDTMPVPGCTVILDLWAYAP